MQSNITVEEIFKTLSISDNYNLLSFIKTISENMTNDKNILTIENLSYIRNNRHFIDDEKELIKNFLSVLGKSDLNGQLIHCRTYKDIFSKKLKDNEDKETNKCKSSSILVFGIGFLIIILIN